MTSPIQDLINLIENGKLHSKLDILAECYILKGKHKEQTLSACNAGLSGIPRSAEKYYNETYED